MKETTLNSILKRKKTIMSKLPRGRSHPGNALWNYDRDFFEVYAVLTNKLADTRKRARKMDFEFDLTIEDLCELFFKQKGKCKLTGLTLDFETGTPDRKNPFAVSIDRIKNNKGYVWGNVRLLVHWANNAKSTYTDREFKMFVTEAAFH
jgi:hypothetical protein